MMGSPSSLVNIQGCCYCWWGRYVLCNKSIPQLQRRGMHVLCAASTDRHACVVCHCEAFAVLQACIVACSRRTCPIPHLCDNLMLCFLR